MSTRARIERPRGTHDVVPAEMPLWQQVTGEVERLCGRTVGQYVTGAEGHARGAQPTGEADQGRDQADRRRVRHRT